MGGHVYSPGFEEGAAYDDEPVIASRVPIVMANARAVGHAGHRRASLRLDLDAKLLETVKRRTGLDDPAAVVEFALAHLALDTDFVVAARQRTWEAIDDDLDLGGPYATA